ncbi:MAG TPA: nucleoside triphosphate pyrophosphohydrolase [Spirochaetales bacterium]|nr:nucleoside triphosphate pyrophosphohydrolase [Spirochaetales bacterium]HRY54806.1 nucleoside triphosphate pyrophosphohydrolase [Spirochaetia bacterium]
MGERDGTAGGEGAERRAGEAFGRLYAIVARLRAPDGCPWDREQTPSSLRGSVVEEAYELVEAIGEGDAEHVREEAGDLYLLATMIAYMHEEGGAFSVADSLDSISAKLVRRHPHVFGEAEAATPDAVLRQWNEIKEKVEGRRAKDSILDAVPRALPPLERANKVQKKAAKAGFDWVEPAAVWAKAREELAEAEEACEASAAAGDKAALEEELGDLLFSAVNLSRFLGVDPSLALHGAVEKFCRRFRGVEKGMAARGLALAAENMAAMDELWDSAKAEERAGGRGPGRDE